MSGGDQGVIHVFRYSKGKASLEKTVKPGNTRDAVALLESGKADVGILPAMRVVGEPLICHAIPESLAPAPQMKLAACARARSSVAARGFSEFVHSRTGAAILAKHGFSPCADQD